MFLPLLMNISNGSNGFASLHQSVFLICSFCLAPDSSHTEPESPKREKSGSFTGRGHVSDVRDEVDARVKKLVRKQDTEEEDIDELVRTFKESEASVSKDVGDAGECTPYGRDNLCPMPSPIDIPGTLCLCIVLVNQKILCCCVSVQ